MFSKCIIPPSEVTIYFFTWTLSVLYSIYSFASKADHFFQNYEDQFSDFSPSWLFTNRRKDVADYEWQTFKYLIEKLTLWIILSTIVSEILRKVRLNLILQLWQIIVTITFICVELSHLALYVILFQPIIFSILLQANISRTLIWCSNAVILLLISIFKNFIAIDDFLITSHLNELTYITILSIFWMNLRCVSFLLDHVDVPEKPRKIAFFAYALYLPLMFCGPFISFRDFQNDEKKSSSFSKRASTLLINITRFTFWSFIIEIALHFIYVNATAFHPEWVESLDSWSLYGYGYTMGQFFHMKYLVIYGFATSFARFEHITVPSLPVCIGRIHLYSDMWKYFDAGLYKFLLKYIYLPVISLPAINNYRFLGSFICFAFVYIWHGTDDYILIWAFFNYLGVVLESFAAFFKRKYFREKQDSRRVQTLGCVLASPLLALSAISNFYFFARTSIGNIFVTHILNGTRRDDTFCNILPNNKFFRFVSSKYSPSDCALLLLSGF